MGKESLSIITIKTLLAVIIFTGVGTIIVGGGLLIADYRKVSEPTKLSQEQPTEIIKEEIKDETADWQVYRNEEYGFEVKYPEKWNYNGGPLPYTFYFGESGPYDYQVGITVEENSSIEKFKDSYQNCEKTFVDNKEGLKCEGRNWIETERGVEVNYFVNYIYIKIKNNDRFYLFSVFASDESLDRIKTFNQILSTFKFIEKDKTSDWQTYTNKELNISFKYPSTWKAPRYTKPKENERFGSYGIQGMIDFNSYGSITILDKNKFNNDYQQCLEFGDKDTCQKAFGRDYNELLKQISFIKSLQNKNLTDNKYSHCYGKIPCSGIEDFDCNAIGGYITLRTIHNNTFNVNTARTIGFCGYDVGIQNYYYYVPLSVNDKLVEIRFKLFPYNSTVYEWGNKEQGYDEANNWEKFSEEFIKSLWENNPNKLIGQEIKQYDLLSESIFLK